MWLAVLLIEVELIVAELLGVCVEGVDLIGAVSDLVKEDIRLFLVIF